MAAPRGNHNRLIDLTGMTIGNYTVISWAGGTRWNVRCVCGVEKCVTGQNIRLHRGNSCGCSRRKANHQSGGFGELRTRYRCNAKTRNLPFELTDEEFVVLTKGNCHYCGAEPSQVVRSKRYWREPYLHNGIDRIDSKLGYTVANCVPCCWTCNQMKFDLGYEQFLNQVAKIQTHLQQKESSPCPR
jgi:hypothetical protein